MIDSVSKTNSSPHLLNKILRDISQFVVEGRFPTFLGVLLLIVQVCVGFLFIQNRRFSILATKNSINPKEVKISNLTDKSFTVSWITDKKTEGSLILGHKENNLTSNIESQQKSEKVYVHAVDVQGLAENTDYYLIIMSDGFHFTNNQKPWHVKTGKSINSVPISENIAGRVIKNNGSPAENTAVYVSVNGSLPLSSLTNSDGQWVVNLGLARNQNNDDYIKLVKNKTPIEIHVQSGVFGVTYARATFDSQNILEPMTLGEVYVFNPKQSGNNDRELLEAKLIF